VRQGYGGEPVNGLISARVYFGWCVLTATAASLGKISPRKERVSHDSNRGGGVTSALRIYAQRGVSSTCALTIVRAALLAHLIYLCTHNCSLQARFASHLTTSLGKVPPFGTL
jgi:hypothetical protein